MARPAMEQTSGTAHRREKWREPTFTEKQSGHAYRVEAQRVVTVLLFITSDEPERHHLRGVSLRSHDLPAPGKAPHRRYS